MSDNRNFTFNAEKYIYCPDKVIDNILRNREKLVSSIKASPDIAVQEFNLPIEYQLSPESMPTNGFVDTKLLLTTDFSITMPEDEIELATGIDKANYLKYIGNLISNKIQHESTPLPFTITDPNGEVVASSYKDEKEILKNKICPVCFSHIQIGAPSGTGAQTWDNDPIKTPQGFAGKEFIGFQNFKRNDIIDLQEKRLQQESEVGAARTVFSDIYDTNGRFIINKNHIKELRESTERILNATGQTKLSYFNSTEDGENTYTVQNDWINSDLDSYMGHIRAVHIEDLRHPLLTDISNIYVASGNTTGYIKAWSDTFGEVLNTTEVLSEEHRCTDGTYIYTLIEPDYPSHTDGVFYKYAANGYSLVDSKSFYVLTYKEKTITAIDSIACDKNYIYVFGGVHVTNKLNEWGVFKLTKEPTIDEASGKTLPTFTVVDYYTVSASLVGAFDRLTGRGLAISSSHIYFILYKEDNIIKAQDPRFWYHFNEPITNLGGEIHIISINKNTKVATQSYTRKVFGLSDIYISGNYDELEPIMLGAYEDANNTWTYYNTYQGIDTTHIDIRNTIALDNTSDSDNVDYPKTPCLYFHLIERTVHGWKSPFQLEYIGHFQWAVGWHRGGYKRGEAIMKAPLNEDGSVGNIEIFKDTIQRCSLAVGVGSKLHCYGIPNKVQLYVDRKRTLDSYLWDLPIAWADTDFLYNVYDKNGTELFSESTLYNLDNSVEFDIDEGSISSRANRIWSPLEGKK